MRKFLSALTAFSTAMMITCAAECAGGVTGFVHLQQDLGFTVVGDNGGRGAGEHGSAGIGWAIGGEPKPKRTREIRMQLISCSENLKSLTDDEINRWYKDGIAPDGKRIFFADAENGQKYEFSEIPADEYFLVIITNAMSGFDMKPKTTKINEELESFMPRWDSYQLLTIGMNQYAVAKVSVKDGAMTRFDYDFAAPPFSEK